MDRELRSAVEIVPVRHVVKCMFEIPFLLRRRLSSFHADTAIFHRGSLKTKPLSQIPKLFSLHLHNFGFFSHIRSSLLFFDKPDPLSFPIQTHTCLHSVARTYLTSSIFLYSFPSGKGPCVLRRSLFHPPKQCGLKALFQYRQ